jgi:signal transduction histidine kinase
MSRALGVKLFIVFLVFVISLVNHDLVFANHFEHFYTYEYKNIFITALGLGVILATSIYNLALFAYLKSRQHLYYALAQIFTLLFLINLDSLNIKPFDEIFGFSSVMFVDIYQILMLIFSLLFIREFSKAYIGRKSSKLIMIIIALALSDLILTLIFAHSVFSKLIPIFVPIALILSEFYSMNDKKDIPFYFLLIGWGIVLFVVAIEYIGFIDFTGLVFPFLHIALAIDSLMLSFAISYKFKLIEEDRRVQQNILLKRSRLASMGEMISIIAHQWRQPLNFLSFSLMSIKKECDDDKSQKLIIDANNQLQHLSKTIDNFREFYNTSKHKENFLISSAIYNAINLSHIDKIKVNIIDDFKFYANKNEFEQVILNILNNAKEAKESDLIIEIEIKKPNITVKDNAKGIKKEIQDKIFEPYFTTKKDGDGIGLYISKIIIESQMNGKLHFKSDKNGTIFYINLY